MRDHLATGLLFAVASACNFDVTVGKDDGIAPVRYEETVTGLPTNLSVTPDGQRPVTTRSGATMTLTIATATSGARQLSLARDLEVFDDAQSAKHLDHFGPDEIGAIRHVSLALVESRYDGLDATRAAQPALTIGSRTLQPGEPGDTSVDLDGATVEAIRVDLLTPKAVELPFRMTFTIPADAPDALAQELHIVVLLQPTLTVDATRAL